MLKRIVGEKGKNRVGELEVRRLSGSIEETTMHLCSEQDCLRFLLANLHELEGQSCKINDKRVHFLSVKKCNNMSVVLWHTCVQEIPLGLVKVTSATMIGSLLWIWISWM
jgi:hypothetical protein